MQFFPNYLITVTWYLACRYDFANGVMLVVALLKYESRMRCVRFSELMLRGIFESGYHDLLALYSCTFYVSTLY